jgi:hypothetical protein
MGRDDLYVVRDEPEQEEVIPLSRRETAGLVIVGGTVMAVILAGFYLAVFCSGMASAIGAVLVMSALLLLVGLLLVASSNDNRKRGQ